jgi:hypothetical protein
VAVSFEVVERENGTCKRRRSVKLANIVRIGIGFIFLAGAAVNAYLGLTQPQIYRSFADTALIPLYRDLWQSLVVPNLGFWLALTVAFEVTTGLLILSKGVRVKVGLGLGILFCLILVPFWWQGGALSNILLALVQARLLRFEYDTSLVDLVRRRRSLHSD